MLNYAVRIFPIKNPVGKVRAFASIIIDDVLEVRGFRIVEGSRGLFVSPPQREGKDKEGNRTWYDDVLWREEKEEGQYRGPVQEHVYNSILTEFQDGQRDVARAVAAEAHTKSELDDSQTAPFPAPQNQW